MTIKQYSKNINMIKPEGSSLTVATYVIKNSGAAPIKTPLDYVVYNVYSTQPMNFNLGSTTFPLTANSAYSFVVNNKTIQNTVNFAAINNTIAYSPNNLFAGGSWTSIIYAQNKFVLVSNSNNSNTVVVLNDDGSGASTSLPTSDFSTWKLAYGKPQFGIETFVIVSSDSSNLIRFYSTNGTYWQQTNGFFGFAGDVAYGNNYFATANEEHSTDGVTWNSFYGTAQPGKAIVYGGDKFVKTTTTSAGRYSTDGQNWTSMTFPTNTSWNSVAYGNGTFVAVNSLGTAKAGAASSTDGITWTSRTMPLGTVWNSVIYGNGLFVAVANNGGGYSTNGITWTLMTMPGSPTTYNWNSQAYGNGKYYVANQTVAANLDTGIYQIPTLTTPAVVGIFKGSTNVLPY